MQRDFPASMAEPAVVGEALPAKRRTIEGPFPDAEHEAIVPGGAMEHYGA